MAKVFSLHLLSLKAGCTGEQFEAYMRDVMERATPLPGVKHRLVKGDRGDRDGKYAFLIEIESAERRDELFPTPGPGAADATPEVEQWFATNGHLWEAWQDYATPINVIYTDYVVVAE